MARRMRKGENRESGWTRENGERRERETTEGKRDERQRMGEKREKTEKETEGNFFWEREDKNFIQEPHTRDPLGSVADFLGSGHVTTNT